MINSAEKYPISQLLNIFQDLIYRVPPYQREYTWEKRQLDDFFDDILGNDNGYFLGSMICINRSNDSQKTQVLELVDGQQRMVTLSILFAAIYSILNEYGKNDEETEKSRITSELEHLKLMLVRRKNEDDLRVVPQVSNDDLRIYRSILSRAGIFKSYSFQNPTEDENNLVYKAYDHLHSRLSMLSDSPEGRFEAIMDILDKLRDAMLVKIEVSNTSDAYMLFESLNNRGVELSSVDLIKNKLFQNISGLHPDKIDYYSECWKKLMGYLDDDYKVKERFFRHYYNAFRKNLLSDKEREGIRNSSIATRSNIMLIYKKLIAKDPEEFLDIMLDGGYLYSLIIGRNSDINYPFEKPLLNLLRVEGTPSYLLLLYLFKKKEQLGLDNEHLSNIAKLLVKFFVRRNLTDRPATNSLTPFFMKLIDEITGLSGESVVEKIQNGLILVSSDDDEFREFLKGPIYSESSSLDRYILCTIEAEDWPKKEPIYDLWKKSNERYNWTIEHILPQGKNIPPQWIYMIAEGDESRAKELQAQHKHRLGNLTLTGYNPNLGTLSFVDKRDRKDEEGNFIGYKNRLHLNDDVRDNDKWTIYDIENRTSRLVDKAVQLFSLRKKNELAEIQRDEKKPNPMDRFFLDPDAIQIIKRGDGKPVEEKE